MATLLLSSVVLMGIISAQVEIQVPSELLAFSNITRSSNYHEIPEDYNSRSKVEELAAKIKDIQSQGHRRDDLKLALEQYSEKFEKIHSDLKIRNTLEGNDKGNLTKDIKKMIKQLQEQATEINQIVANTTCDTACRTDSVDKKDEIKPSEKSVLSFESVLGGVKNNLSSATSTLTSFVSSSSSAVASLLKKTDSPPANNPKSILKSTTEHPGTSKKKVTIRIDHIPQYPIQVGVEDEDGNESGDDSESGTDSESGMGSESETGSESGTDIESNSDIDDDSNYGDCVESEPENLKESQKKLFKVMEGSGYGRNTNDDSRNTFADVPKTLEPKHEDFSIGISNLLDEGFNSGICKGTSATATAGVSNVSQSDSGSLGTTEITIISAVSVFVAIALVGGLLWYVRFRKLRSATKPSPEV